MKKHFTLIGAIAINAVYGQGRGKEGKIPWRSKEDLNFFKNTTMGHTIIMTRGTWESIPTKYRPFDGRTNYIVTTNPEFCLTAEEVEKGVKVFNSFDSALKAVSTEKAFGIGGSKMWYECEIFTDELLINTIEVKPVIDEDTIFFPGLLFPLKYFKEFIQEGEPIVLSDGSSTPKVTAYRFVRKQ